VALLLAGMLSPAARSPSAEAGSPDL